jgi:hypothetical protein
LSDLLEVLKEIEAAGASLRIEGNKVRIIFVDDSQRNQLANQVSFLRQHRDDVMEWLKARATVPEMPPGIRLLHWKLKEPPVAIEMCAVVTDPSQFARVTLEQLAIAVSEQPKRCVGWTVPQLVERLAQVGVGVSVGSHGMT